MSFEYLPNEILVNIFEFLNFGDLLTANLVCRTWRSAASIALEERVTILAADEFYPGLDVLKESVVQYKYWAFKNIDINYRGSLEPIWDQFAAQIKSLSLCYVDIPEKDLLIILQKCFHLEQLYLTGFSQIFMTAGTFIENEEDLIKLKDSLQNVRTFRLSCSRYLTDSIFSRFTLLVGNLRELSLSGCQISYQNSIWKRFYPADGSVKASEHVLTFKYILNFIEDNKATLKSLDLGRTSIDSDSLAYIGQIPGLSLESIHLESCDQLTSTGIQRLTQYQKQLVELDLGLCSRLTDYSVIAIADNLPQLKSLNVKRCQGLTEVGLENLSRLRFLERLDISHLDVRKWESIHQAIASLVRPSMKWLSVASLPIQWETVVVLGDMMPNLKYLDLSMCVMGMSDRSIQAICKSLVKLEVLLLNGCALVSDIGLSGHGLDNETELTSEISSLQLSLETLGIKEKDPYKIALGSRAEKEIRQEAEVKKYLESQMSRIIKSSEYGLKNITGLKQLNLCGCLRITDLTLCYALQFRELTYLNLSHCQQVNEEGLIEVCMNCPSLQELYLTECTNATDKVILILVHWLKRINTLDLQKCVLLTNDSLDSLSTYRNLRYLDVSYCRRMTLEAVIDLKKRIPRLSNLHHRGIKSSLGGDKEEEQAARRNKKLPTPPPLLSKLIKKIRS